MSRQKSQEDLQNLRNSIDQYFYKYNKCTMNNNSSSPPIQEKLKRLEKLKNLNTVQTVIIDKIHNELNQKICGNRLEISTPPKLNQKQQVIFNNCTEKENNDNFYTMTSINSFSNEEIEDMDNISNMDNSFKKCFKPKSIYNRLIDRLKIFRN